jgi:purine nucleosidase/pyrimidine-specific ribonucleoside hydrolase
MVKKVMIDCDAGVDDAFALILAFHSPDLEVQAVTGVNGNVPLNQVFENIQKVLSLIRPSHKPLIAKGADQPLKGKTIYAHSVHGKSGLGETKIELKEGEEWWKISPDHADEFITKTARQHPKELTLIATGPLTNLALALQRDRAGMKKLKEVVIMGGAVRTKGNITLYAEFNIFSDPVAAKIVFESGLPITLVPLDVTHQVFLTSRWMEDSIRPLNNRFSKFVIEATGYDLVTQRFPNKEVVYLHDPLAVGVAISPDLVRKERLSLTVETQEGEYYGHISEVREGSKIDVCLEADAKGFLDLFLSRLS